MVFTPNKKFRKDYHRLFKRDREAANLFLLVCELADQKGQFETSEKELAELMAKRFKDPGEYAL